MKLVLSDAAVKWFNEYGLCLITSDYIAYIWHLPKKYKAALVVEVGEAGRWSIIPSNPAKPPRLIKRWYKKALLFLVKGGWLEVEDKDTPFEEFNIKPTVEVGKTYLILPDKLFQEAGFEIAEDSLSDYDDDASELDVFWEENA